MARVREATADRRGSVAVEFAVITPVLIIIMLSLYDVTTAVVAWWQLSAAAGAIARITTTYAATTTGTNSISTTQAATASTAVFAVMPALAVTPASLYGVVVSSVVMTPTVAGCVGNCSYVANTAWSVALQGSPTVRPCGRLNEAADGQPSSTTALAVDAFTPAPLIVVDVTYQFVPLFNTLFGAGLPFMETAYMATRTGTDAAWVRLTGPNASLSQCPGYTG